MVLTYPSNADLPSWAVAVYEALQFIANGPIVVCTYGTHSIDSVMVQFAQPVGLLDYAIFDIHLRFQASFECFSSISLDGLETFYYQSY